MAQDLIMTGLGANAPAILAGRTNTLADSLAQGIAGQSFDKLSIRASRFRIIENGVEVHVSGELSMNAVMIGSQAHHSRIFYLNGWDEEAERTRPDCFSRDGVTPAADAPLKQSSTCSSCPRNVKGSGRDGRGKACSYKKRIVIVPRASLQEGALPKVYAFDVNGKSIFGEGVPGKNLFSLSGYAKFLSTRRQGFPTGVFPQTLETTISFNTAESVPAVLFSPAMSQDGRAVSWLTEPEYTRAFELGATEQVKLMLSMSAADTSDAEGGAAPGVLAQTTQGNRPVSQPTNSTPSGKPTPGMHWKTYALNNGFEEDDLEPITSAGGPGTELGAKRWAKLIELPLDGIRLTGEPGDPVAGQPATLESFIQGLISSGQAEQDDIEMIMAAGGPGTEKGARLWAKLVGVPLPSFQAAAPKQTLDQFIAGLQAAGQIDNDDLEMIMDAGGPRAEKGLRLWTKLVGIEIPADLLSGAATPAAAPVAIVKMPWPAFARNSGYEDEDDLALISQAGGPGTEKGLRLWNKLIGIEIDLAMVDVGPEPEGRKTTKDAKDAKPAKPARTPRASKTAAPAAAPAPTPVPMPPKIEVPAVPIAAPAGSASTAGADLAAAVAAFAGSGFDDAPAS